MLYPSKGISKIKEDQDSGNVPPVLALAAREFPGPALQKADGVARPTWRGWGEGRLWSGEGWAVHRNAHFHHNFLLYIK